MAGPGGREVARVSAKVVADTSDLPGELRRTLSSLERSMRLEVEVGLDADGLRAELAAELRSLSRESVDISVGADLTEARNEVAAAVADIRAQSASIDVGAATEEARAEARATVAEIDRMKATIKVDLDVDRSGLRGLGGRGGGRGGGLSGMVGVFGDLFSVGSKLPGLLGTVAGGLGSLISTGSKAGSALGGVATGLGGVARAGVGAAGAVAAVVLVLADVLATMTQFGAKASLVAAVAGAVAFAVGAIGAAASGLPALLFGAAAAGGAVALGFDGIKRAAKVAAPALNELKAAVSGVFERELTPMFRDIAKVLPQLRTGFEGVAVSVSGMVRELAGVFTSTEGVRGLQQVLGNTRVLIDTMTPGLKRMVSSLLDAARTTGAFRELGAIISMLGDRVGELFRRFSAGGETSLMVRSLGALRGVLNAAAGAFNELILGATEFFTSAGPGVEDMFGSLQRTLSKIPWRSLGESFGVFARAVGRFFEQIPQSTWDDLASALGEVARAFSDLVNDPAAADFFTDLIGFVSFCIRLFGTFLDVVREVAGWLRNLWESNRHMGRGRQLGSLGDIFGGGPGGDVATPDIAPWERWRDQVRTLLDEVVALVTERSLAMVTALTTGLVGLGPAATNGWLPVQLATTTALQQLTDAITLAFSSTVPLAVTTGMQAVLTALQLGWQQALVTTQTQLAQLQLAVQTALGVNLGLTVTNAMLAVVNAFVLGWQQATLASQNGLLLLSNTVQIGLAQLAGQVTALMSIVVAQVQQGFANATVAAQVGTAAMVAAVIAGMLQIAAVTGPAMSGFAAAVQGGMSRATAAVQAGMAGMVAAVAGGFGAIAGIVRGGIAGAVAAVVGGFAAMAGAAAAGIGRVMGLVTSLPGRIRGALGSLGGLLVSAGRALMDGLLRGIKAGLSAVLSFVGTIAGKVHARKGPLSYDKRVLIDNGLALMAGLRAGLTAGLSTVLSDVAGYAAQIADQRSAFHAVGVTLGQRIGDGVAAGMTSAFANLPDVVRHGSVSARVWDQLIGAGWRGRAGDGMEALYRPVREAATAPVSSPAQSAVSRQDPYRSPAITPEMLRRALDGMSFRVEDDGRNGLARIVDRQQRRGLDRR